jgi:glycosyltransferase involved in cell wall biosynthesis
MKTNLLYVITKLELGGAQKQILALLRSLNKEEFKPFLFTAQDGILLNEAMRVDGLTVIKSRYLQRPINPLKDLLAIIEIYKFIKKNNIEIVHTHSSKAGILGRLAARLAKVKAIIHTVHGWSFNDYQPSLKRIFFIWLERISANFTHRLVVVSQRDKQRGLNMHIGGEDKYVIISYGIDYSEFSAAKKNQGLRREFGIDADDIVVAMVSCFKPQKAPRDFIKLAQLVCRDIPKAKFILVGDGVLRKNIERWIYEFNLQERIILTGWRKDVPRILSETDIFVLTSLWEGLPISVLEAMAAALPIVATNTGGISEIISEGKTGFLVAPRDMDEMNRKLGLLLKDEDLRKRIGQNARDSLDGNFCIKNMKTQNENLYRGLISTKEVKFAS